MAKVMKLNNLARLEAYAAKAKRKGAQIIVFPEYGITGYVDFNRSTVLPFAEEIPSSTPNPCDEAGTLPDAPAIVRASCAAKELEMVLVINLLTRVPCIGDMAKGCPADGMRVYNTAIAFSEKGATLALYHKRHLWYSEMAFADPGEASMKGGVTFTTSFGVKFGMFICFDLLFFTDGGPDAKEIIFPTDWTNKVWINNVRVHGVPTALQAERQWSSIHHKNLIAANYGGSGKLSSGSGIWHEGEALQSFFNPTSQAEEKLLVADVPVMDPGRYGGGDGDVDQSGRRRGFPPLQEGRPVDGSQGLSQDGVAGAENEDGDEDGSPSGLGLGLAGAEDEDEDIAGPLRDGAFVGRTGLDAEIAGRSQGLGAGMEDVDDFWGPWGGVFPGGSEVGERGVEGMGMMRLLARQDRQGSRGSAVLDIGRLLAGTGCGITLALLLRSRHFPPARFFGHEVPLLSG
jgi:predicted amidohydrolase